MTRMKVLTVVGARPQFIKSSAVSQAITGTDCMDEILIHTGQHFDAKMSEVFFQQLGLREPDYHLGVGNEGHGSMTGKMLATIEQVLLKENPAVLLVYGDTNSTLAGALAAAKLHVPIVHVEAGLRSFNRRMPEEINRVLTDHVSSLLCCPTKNAVAQLRNEGFECVANAGEIVAPEVELQLPETPADEQRWVVNVGDVMLDVLLNFKDKAEKQSSVLSRLKLSPQEYVLVTIHRAEATADTATLQACLAELKSLANVTTVVFPVHPRTRKVLEKLEAYSDMAATRGMCIIDPLPYLDFIKLQANASAILTDSGGVQKEAFFLNVPCLTLREETEWVETVESGGNRLIGPAPTKLAELIEDARTEPARTVRKDWFGRGDAGKLITRLISRLYA